MAWTKKQQQDFAKAYNSGASEAEAKQAAGIGSSGGSSGSSSSSYAWNKSQRSAFAKAYNNGASEEDAAKAAGLGVKPAQPQNTTNYQVNIDDATGSDSKMGEYTSWLNNASSGPQGYNYTSTYDLDNVAKSAANYINTLDYTHEDLDNYRAQIASGQTYITDQMARNHPSSTIYKQMKLYGEQYSDLMAAIDRGDYILNTLDYLDEKDDRGYSVWHTKEQREQVQADMENEIDSLISLYDSMEDKNSAAAQQLLGYANLYSQYLYADILKKNEFESLFTDASDHENYLRAQNYGEVQDIQNKLAAARNERDALLGVDKIEDNLANRAPTALHGLVNIAQGIYDSGVGGIAKLVGKGVEELTSGLTKEQKAHLKELDELIAGYEETLAPIQAWQDRILSENSPFDLNTNYAAKIKENEALINRADDNTDVAMLQTQNAYYQKCIDKQKRLGENVDVLAQQNKDLEALINKNVLEGKSSANPALYAQLEEQRAYEDQCRLEQDSWRKSQTYKTETRELKSGDQGYIDAGKAALAKNIKKESAHGVVTLGGKKRTIPEFALAAVVGSGKPEEGKAESYISDALTDNDKNTFYRLLGKAIKTGTDKDVQTFMDYCDYLDDYASWYAASEYHKATGEGRKAGEDIFNVAATGTATTVAGWAKHVADWGGYLAEKLGADKNSRYYDWLQNFDSEMEFLRMVNSNVMQDAGSNLTNQSFMRTGKNAAQLGLGVLNTVAGMLPSTAIGGFVGDLGIAGGMSKDATERVAKLVSTSLLGLSAANTATAEARSQGYSEGRSLAYGTAIGATEAASEYWVESVFGRVGISEGKIAEYSQNINKAGLKFAAQMGGRIAGEQLEEYMQNKVEYLVNDMILNQYERFAIADQKDWETLVSTAASTAFLELLPLPFGGSSVYNNTIGAEKVGRQITGQTTMKVPSKASAEMAKNINEAGKALGTNENTKNTLVILAQGLDPETLSGDQKVSAERAKELAEGMESGKIKPTNSNLGELYMNYAGALESADLAALKLWRGAMAFSEVEKRNSANTTAQENLENVRKANPDAQVLDTVQSELRSYDGTLPLSEQQRAADIINAAASGRELTAKQVATITGNTRTGQAIRTWLGNHGAQINAKVTGKAALEALDNYIAEVNSIKKTQRELQRANVLKAAQDAETQAKIGVAAEASTPHIEPQTRVPIRPKSQLFAAQQQAAQAQEAVTEAQGMSIDELAAEHGMSEDKRQMAKGLRQAKALDAERAAIQKQIEELRGRYGTVISAENNAKIKELQQQYDQKTAQIKEISLSLARGMDKAIKAKQSESTPAATSEVVTVPGTNLRLTREDFIAARAADGVSEAEANTEFDTLLGQSRAINGTEVTNGRGQNSDNTAGRQHDVGTGEQSARDTGRNRTAARGPVRATRSVSIGNVQAEVEEGANVTDINDIPDELVSGYPALRNTLNTLKQDGFTNIAFVHNGRLVSRNAEGKVVPVPAIYRNGTLIVGLDNDQASVDGTIHHERFHHFIRRLTAAHGAEVAGKFIRGALQHLLTEEQYIEAFRNYRLGVGNGGYQAMYPELQGAALVDAINEEILSDIFGGINNFNLTLGDMTDQLQDYFEEAAEDFSISVIDIGRTVHGVAEDTLLNDNNVDNPSTEIADVGEVTKLAFYGTAQALGFEVNTKTQEKALFKNGERVDTVTIEDIKNSPTGALIDYAQRQGFIDEDQAKQEYDMFAAIGTLANSVNDFSMAMQFMGSTIFTAMKANADTQYGTTYDFPSICTKTQAVIDDMSAQMVRLGRSLTEDEILEIYQRQFTAGNPVPCPECYVFSRWVGIGGLLDNIKSYQETFGNLSFEEMERIYQEESDKVRTRAEAAGLSFGKARGALVKEFDKKITDLEKKIQNAEDNGRAVSQEDNAQYEALKRERASVQALTWIDKVYFGGKEEHTADNVNPRRIVPDAILYDLNKGEEFASKYKEAWGFRTTQGAGYGKAITPYAEAILGEGILVTNATATTIKNKAAGKLNNVFLTEKGEITDKSERGKKLKAARKKQLNQLFIGGQRLQSTSDARFDNATDYLLAGLEMQSMQSGAQIYTKVPGAVHFFDLIGACTNMSLMPKGSGMENSVPTDTTVGGMNPETAQQLRQENEHAGTITIGVNDNHIRTMFAQVWRDFIIPYHASGGKMSLIEAFRKIQDSGMVKTTNSSDYTKTQSDKLLSDTNLAKLGKTQAEIEDIHKFRETRLAILTGKGTLHREMLNPNVEGLTRAQQEARKILQQLYVSTRPGGRWYDSDLGTSIQLAKGKVEHQIFPNEFWDTKSTYENSGVNTQRYLDYCDSLGILHRFSGKAVVKGEIVPVKGYDENGSETYLTDLAYKNGVDASDGIEDFFWKTLTDRRMYGNNGQYLEQPRVTLSKVNAEDVTSFAAPMGERRYSRSTALRTAAQPLTGAKYSLQNLDYDIEPTSDAWQRDHTTAEVKEMYPGLWDITADESEVRNPTQVKDTVKTYRKIYDILKAEGFNGKILDASSGLGYGTQAGREEYGFDVEDIEPYPDKSYTPQYTDYDSLNEKYDAIISNAVLNVLPQDQRDALVVKMGELLNPGGRIFINVRGDDVKTNKSNQPIGGKWEYYVSSTGSYQKGFTKPELKAYLQDALGPGFDVQITDKYGKTSAIVTKEATQTGPLQIDPEVENRQYERGTFDKELYENLIEVFNSPALAEEFDFDKLQEEIEDASVKYSYMPRNSDVLESLSYARDILAPKGVGETADRINSMMWDIIQDAAPGTLDRWNQKNRDVAFYRWVQQHHAVANNGAPYRTRYSVQDTTQQAEANLERLKGALNGRTIPRNDRDAGRNSTWSKRQLSEAISRSYTADTVRDAEDRKAVADAIKAAGGTSQEYLIEDGEVAATIEAISPDFYTNEMLREAAANKEHGFDTKFYYGHPVFPSGAVAIAGFADAGNKTLYIRVDAPNLGVAGIDKAGWTARNENEAASIIDDNFTISSTGRHERFHLLKSAGDQSAQALFDYINNIGTGKQFDGTNFWYQRNKSQDGYHFEDYAEELAADFYAGSLAFANNETQNQIQEMVFGIDNGTEHGARYSIQTGTPVDQVLNNPLVNNYIEAAKDPDLKLDPATAWMMDENKTRRILDAVRNYFSKEDYGGEFIDDAFPFGGAVEFTRQFFKGLSEDPAAFYADLANSTAHPEQLVQAISDALNVQDSTEFDPSFEPTDLDNEYLQAVKNNDVATMARIVNEIAANAGYDTYDVYEHELGPDSSSQPGDRAYQHSAERLRFEDFDRGDFGIHVGSFSQAADIITNGESIPLPLRVKIDTGLPVADMGRWWVDSIAKFIVRVLDRVGPTPWWFGQDELDAIDELRPFKKHLENLANNKNAHTNDFNSPYRKTLSNILEARGFDAMKYWNDAEGSGEDGNMAYLVWRPSQVKSADLITYDKDGNIIPPSQRFNENDKRYRYSIQGENTTEDIIEAAGDMRKAADLYPVDSLEHELLNVMASNDADSIMEWVNSKVSEYLGKPSGLAPEPTPILAKMTDAELKSLNKGIDKLINKYGQLKEGDQRQGAKPFPLPAKTKDNNKVHKHAGTVGEADSVDEIAKPYTKRFVLTDEAATYVPSSNAKDIKSAQDTIKQIGFDRALTRFEALSDAIEIPTTQTVALGEQLLIETAANNDMGNFLKVLAATCEMSGQLGKSLQAFSLLKKSGPIGQLYYVQKVVDRMNQKTYKDRIASGKMAPILISDAEAKAVMTAKDEAARDKAMENLIASIAEQVPVTLADKWNSWRYLSMLGNPRTHVRNLIGNALFVPLIFAKDMLAAGGEFLAERLGIISEEQRTKNAAVNLGIDVGGYREFAKNDALAVRKELQGNGKYNPANEIMQARKVLPGFLDNLSKWNGKKLEQEDWIFLKRAYVSALSQALANSGYTTEQLYNTTEGAKALNEARRVAIEEAQRATYRDFSQTAAALNRFKQINSGKGKLAALAIEGVVPFTKTPINILKRGIEYSPIGLMTSLAQVAKGVATGNYTNATEIIDRLAAGLTGTGLAIIGALLAKIGWIRGKKDDDKQEKFDLLHGEQDYSLKIGDHSFTIDWAAPSALPLFTGVAALQLLEGDNEFGMADIWDAAMMIAEPMMSLSMLDGINKVLKSTEYADDNAKVMSIGKSAFSSYFGQAFPTLLGQVARTIDPVRRTSYNDKNSKVSKDLQSFYQNNVASKIPGLESTKPEYIDQWGRTQTNNNILLRAIENFIAPGYSKKIEITPVDDELQRLYDNVKDDELKGKILPKDAVKGFTVAKEDFNMTADQYVSFAKDLGQTSYNLLNDAIYDNRYLSLQSDEEKAKAVDYFYEYAKAAAKYHVNPDFDIHKSGKWKEEAEAAKTDREREDIIWKQIMTYIEKNMRD